MTNLERAMNILHYKPVDRLPAVHFSYWSDLLTEWADQGKISRELAVGNHDGSEKEKELDKIIGWDFNWNHVVGTNNGATVVVKDAFTGTVHSTTTLPGASAPDNRSIIQKTAWAENGDLIVTYLAGDAVKTHNVKMPQK